MRVVRDLCGNIQPSPFDVIYNTDIAASGTNARYRGSLVKAMDHDDEDNGRFFVFGGDTNAMENVCGILEEDVAASTTYLLNVASGSGNFVRKKMTPITGTTVIEAEYFQEDPAGNTTTDTAYSGTAASTTLTCPSSGTNDHMNGGWVYFLDGTNADYLHYIRDINATTTITLRTALVFAVASADTCLVIAPPLAILLDFGATYCGITSDCVEANMTDEVCGIDTWISAPGLPKQKLNQDLDGLKIANARFFHHFTLPYENYWCSPNRA